MPSRQQIKSRIRSVSSTKQITRAMQLVSASKLRRAQEAVLGPRLYGEVARQMLVRLRGLTLQDNSHPLFTTRPVKRRLLIAVGSNRSLAGAYNANVFRALVKQIAADREAGIQTSVICIGRQIARHVVRLKDVPMLEVYNDLPDRPRPGMLQPALLVAFEAFERGEVDAVTMLYTEFKSTISQVVTQEQLLPAGLADVTAPVSQASALVEPDLAGLIDATALRFLGAQLQEAYLESIASEHATRMVSMKNATDNASDIISDLTLEFNNARQAAITQELSEISAGVEALK